MDQQNKLVVFESKEIRRTWHNEEWWFVVNDIVKAIADTSNAKDYIAKMRRRDDGLRKGWGQIVHPLSIETAGGKQRMNCSNTEGIFRIIQSIPSPNAEPFKKWLAKVGYERIQEIENPELAAKRAREYYKELGYSDTWIDTRLQTIIARGELTDEWKSRDVKEGLEYAILTAEISRATFGLAPKEYKDLKGLKRENLRDHMTRLELIFTMLGEEQTKQETIKDNAIGFEENRASAIKGGRAAGKALDAFEKETGNKIVSSDNFKDQIKEAKKQKRLKKKKDKKN